MDDQASAYDNQSNLEPERRIAEIRQQLRRFLDELEPLDRPWEGYIDLRVVMVLGELSAWAMALNEEVLSLLHSLPEYFSRERIAAENEPDMLRLNELLDLYRRGEIEDGEQKARSYVSDHPGDSHGRHIMGMILVRRGDLQGAREQLSIGSAGGSRSAQLHLLLGAVLLRCGEQADGLATLRRARKLSPTPAMINLTERLEAGEDIGLF